MSNKQWTVGTLNIWEEEIKDTVVKSSHSLCMALFSLTGDLLYSNPAASLLFQSKAKEYFINPTFDDLLKMEAVNDKVFEGFLTVGHLDAFNTSVNVRIYRKNDTYLVIGGVESFKLIEINTQLVEMNMQFSNLQRDLEKKTKILERAYEELDEKNRILEIEKKTREKSLSIIAHDLKTPLSVILNYTSLLKRRPSIQADEDTLIFLDSLRESAENTLQLLDNLLLWARSQTGNFSFNPELFDATQCLEEVLALYSSTFVNKGIKLDFTHSSSLTTFADKNMFKTVLRNLFSNAIKFTERGGKVKVDIKPSNDFIEIIIEDNGVGMSEVQIHQILDADLHKSNSTGTEGEVGSGLGLTLCKDFIAKNGGELRIESKEDMGSKFTFSVPLEE